MKEFLQHNSIFGESSNDLGFYKHLDESDNYSDLINIIYPYIINMSSLVGINKTLFDKQFELNIIKYILASIIYELIKYVNELNDDVTTSSDSNELFTSLEQGNVSNIKKKIKDISSLIMDININIIQEHIDPFWVHVLKDRDELSKLISKEKEREKQSLLAKLESMENDERYVSVQLQNIGASNWFREAQKENEKIIADNDVSDDTNLFNTDRDDDDG